MEDTKVQQSILEVEESSHEYGATAPAILDTKLSWFVSACSSMATIVITGSLLSFAILFPDILEAFKKGKARTALVVSLGLALFSIMGPLGAKLCTRYGCRAVYIGSGLTCALGLLGSSFAPSLYVLYITYGIAVGFATSLSYVAGFQVVPLYFDKHRFLAMAIASLGFAAGFMVMSPITQALLVRFGWRKALLVMAGINVIPSILGCSISRRETPSTTEEDTISRTPSEGPSGGRWCQRNFLRSWKLSVFKDPIFVIHTLSGITATMGHYMPYMHLAKYAQEVGIQSHGASQLYVTIGGTALISRLLVGKLCDTKWVAPLRFFQCGAIILAIASCLLPLATTFTNLIFYSVACGVADGMYVTTIFSLMNNNYPGMGFGWFIFCVMFPSLAGPTLAGFIADVSGSYHPAFYTAGGILVLAACMVELTRCIKKKHKPHTLAQPEEIMVIFVEKETVC